MPLRTMSTSRPRRSHRVTVTGEAAALELKAHQLPGDAASFWALSAVSPVKGAALVQLHDPAQPGLERRGGVVDLVAVERVAHLQPQRVAGAQPDRLGAGPDQRLPDLRRVPLPAVQLEAVLAGVAGAGDEALGAGHPAGREVVVARCRSDCVRVSGWSSASA